MAVPGRVENDIIETETLFHRTSDRLVATGAEPPRARSSGWHRRPRSSRGPVMGVLVGLGLGVGLLLSGPRSRAAHPEDAAAGAG